jgi:effector-binding domain-containing protein
MSYQDIRISHIEPIRALTLRFIAQSHLHFARVVAEIRGAAQQHTFRASSYPIHITHATEYSQNNVENEFVLPIDESWIDALPLATFGTMTVRELPAVDAATYIHNGDPERVNDRLVDLERWVAAHGYTLTGSFRLVYLRGLVVRLPIEEWKFEVQYPLATVLFNR